MKMQLLVDIDLRENASASDIVDAFSEAIHQVAYAYGNAGSWKYIGDVAGSWQPMRGARFVRAEGKTWRSTAMLTKNDNENIMEVKQ